MVWLPFFPLSGRAHSFAFFSSLLSSFFLFFVSVFFLLLLRRFDPLLLIFLPLYFLLSRLFFFVFFFFFSYLPSYSLMLKRKKNESTRYVCIFIRYMYNVLGSAIITIIQLCGLCRLFVHSTLPLLYCCCYHCMGKHSPSTLKVMPLFFCCCFFAFHSFVAYYIGAAVDSSIVRFFFYLSFTRPTLFFFLFFVYVLFCVSVLHLMEDIRFSLLVMCVCVCIIYTMYTYAVDVSGVSAAM